MVTVLLEYFTDCFIRVCIIDLHKHNIVWEIILRGRGAEHTLRSAIKIANVDWYDFVFADNQQQPTGLVFACY